MKNLLSSLAFLAASTLLSSQALAGLTTWSNTQALNQYIGVFGNHSYAHDLTGGTTSPFAFLPAGMTALKGTISIELYEDVCVGGGFACWGNNIQEALSPEIVLFQIEDFDFDTGSLQLSLNDFHSSLGINAIASINDDGKLDIVVQSLGDDFLIGRSTLTIEGVPEPEMLGLLGASLLALSLLNRRRVTQA